MRAIVTTRSTGQIRSHAQKYFAKLGKMRAEALYAAQKKAALRARTAAAAAAAATTGPVRC